MADVAALQDSERECAESRARALADHAERQQQTRQFLQSSGGRDRRVTGGEKKGEQ